MKLGKRVQIVIGVPDIEKSAEFYTTLGFQKLDENTEPYPWKQFTDGQNLILLNQDGMTYRGLVYFNPDLNRQIEAIEANGVEFFWKQENDDGSLQSAMFIDPTGVDKDGHLNIGVNIVAHDPDGLYVPSGEPCTMLGKYGEFALPVSDFAEAKAFWSKVGFTCVYESQTPYPWGIFMDGLVILGCHEAHSYKTEQSEEFVHPTLTYFAPDGVERIAKIRELGYEPPFELKNDEGVTTGARFESPGGQMLYIFEGDF